MKKKIYPYVSFTFSLFDVCGSEVREEDRKYYFVSGQNMVEFNSEHLISSFFPFGTTAVPI